MATVHFLDKPIQVIGLLVVERPDGIYRRALSQKQKLTSFEHTKGAI